MDFSDGKEAVYECGVCNTRLPRPFRTRSATIRRSM